jgi:hypothetical protein
MSYTKTIVCLANSRKLAGRCVAGKEWDGCNVGAWCRPVSARDRGELTAERWYCKTWRDPKLLDLIEVSLLGPRPSSFQTENHLVDASVRWKYAGHVAAGQLVPALDRPTGPLWDKRGIDWERPQRSSSGRGCGAAAKFSGFSAAGAFDDNGGYGRRRCWKSKAESPRAFFAGRPRLRSGHYRSYRRKTDHVES